MYAIHSIQSSLRVVSLIVSLIFISLVSLACCSNVQQLTGVGRVVTPLRGVAMQPSAEGGEYGLLNRVVLNSGGGHHLQPDQSYIYNATVNLSPSHFGSLATALGDVTNDATVSLVCVAITSRHTQDDVVTSALPLHRAVPSLPLAFRFLCRLLPPLASLLPVSVFMRAVARPRFNMRCVNHLQVPEQRVSQVAALIRLASTSWRHTRRHRNAALSTRVTPF